ncbi:MAG: ribosome-associated translation inhibitor RaiA [Coriobacteriia bacterium]|nr:ribosome-associated translation inhibitor RaiA [Coriobacteriia bacterium]
MKMIVKGRHMDITPAIRDYAEEKIGRVAKILDHMIMSAEVELQVEKNPSIQNGHVAEVTVYTKGHVIRAREAALDMYAAIDLVSEKLERQLRKFKTKIVDRHTKVTPIAEATAVSEEAEGEHEPEIVKTKIVEVKPMSADEAILQLELLGHDFFVFSSAETEEINVLYRRTDGDYGLIEPR